VPLPRTAPARPNRIPACQSFSPSPASTLPGPIPLTELVGFPIVRMMKLRRNNIVDLVIFIGLAVNAIVIVLILYFVIF
jgi:hypothetical protein